jgi:hypothetical protein
MEKLPIGPCAGSCGTAAYRGSAVIVSDIATDPLWNVPGASRRRIKSRAPSLLVESNSVVGWKGPGNFLYL